MDFIANQDPQIQEMLAVLGFKQIEELFEAIPNHLRRPRPVLDDGLSEYEGMRLMEEIAAQNTFPLFDNYLGAGAYEHHVPALIGAICAKSEFLTSYTPYQAEASQGMLQVIFEFQSALCALTGLDVANASVYDGASACAEAVLMALRFHPSRNKILIAQTLHPHYRGVVDQYLTNQAAEVLTIPFSEEGLDMTFIQQQVDEHTAAVLVQYPNFLGQIEDLKALAAHTKAMGALLIVCANPLIYGLFASAAELGADIAVGDCQPLGLPLQFGGPYAGYMVCRQELLRQLPGRIVGETRDVEGKRGFTLTLQAREQHIRREKATSNICTNQALAALACLVGLLWYGKKGMKALALTNYQRAAYLKQSLQQVTGIEIIGKLPTFNEFVVRFAKPIHEVMAHFRAHGIEPGVSLESYFPSLSACLLVAVTETKNQEQLEYYQTIAKSCMAKGVSQHG